MHSQDQIASSRSRNWTTATAGNRSITTVVRNFTRNIALDIACLIHNRNTQPALRCLLFHTVFDDHKSQFKNILQELSSIGTFINTDRCLGVLNGLETVEEPLFHVSFDDGFKNNYENAVPILAELGIPAIFFVTTDLMTCSPARQKQFSVDMGGYSEVLEFMTWDDLRQMVKLGFEIGSHTNEHNRLSGILNDDILLEKEIYDSKLIIETELGSECMYFAWPFGRVADINATILKQIEDSGYRGCFGGFRGTVISGETNPYCIPRHSLEPFWPLRHIKLFLSGYHEKKSRASWIMQYLKYGSLK